MAPNRKVGSLLLVDEQESLTHLVKRILGLIEEDMGEIHFASLKDPSSLAAYLNREGEYWNAPTPDLILVGAKMAHRIIETPQLALQGGAFTEAIPVIPFIVDRDESAKQEAIEPCQNLFRSLLSSWF